VGSAAQIKAMKQVAGKIKGDLAQFRELAAFRAVRQRPRRQDQGQLDRGQRIVEIFKQSQYNPIAVSQQASVLWAVQNGYFDDVPVDKVKDFQLSCRTTSPPAKQRC
jgi:F-type H+-transporting ATPase subunit alpha